MRDPVSEFVHLTLAASFGPSHLGFISLSCVFATVRPASVRWHSTCGQRWQLTVVAIKSPFNCRFGAATVKKCRVHSARESVMSIPITYCQTCHVLRAIRSWYERDETLMIELEPCGHVACRAG